MRPWALAVPVILLTAFQCGEENWTVELELSVRTNPMSAAGGSQFLSVTASGDWEITVSGEDGNAISWLDVSPSCGTGSKSSIVLSVEANEDEADRTAILTLESGAESISLALVQNGKVSGGDDEPGVTAKLPQKYTEAGWLELPATSEDEGLFFIAHSMTIGNVVTRNYSCYYDTTNLVSHWVAYPLNSWTISSGSRTNAWGYDPDISSDLQPCLYKGFNNGSNSGITRASRGHQIPSADRYLYSANVQTFYFTNMTPQEETNFNSDIWANLESSVRSYANRSDTLYVVTGCVVDGSTHYALDNNGRKVTVPVAYYKALLRYSSSSTDNYGYSACAFYLEHKSNSKSKVTADDAMSIDALEAKVGVDFFVNLPARIGETAAANVEAADPSKAAFWGL